MVLLKEAVEQKKFDTRVVEKNVNRGQVSSKDYQKHEGGLPDDESNASWISLDELKAQDDHRPSEGMTPEQAAQQYSQPSIDEDADNAF